MTVFEFKSSHIFGACAFALVLLFVCGGLATRNTEEAPLAPAQLTQLNVEWNGTLYRVTPPLVNESIGLHYTIDTTKAEWDPCADTSAPIDRRYVAVINDVSRSRVVYIPCVGDVRVESTSIFR